MHAGYVTSCTVIKKQQENAKNGAEKTKAAVWKLRNRQLGFFNLNEMSNVKEKFLGASGSVTGSLGVLGGYQVCHNACLALIAFLTFLGFTVAGMPLLFLTKVAVPFWTLALALLVTTIILKFGKNMGFSGKIILLNSGLIIAGIPFQEVERFNYIFWIVGGVLVTLSIWWYLYEKIVKDL